MKKVLIIAYFFPPLGGVGSLRTLKFTKYLPFFGWKPYIISVDKSDYPARDKSLLKEIPKVANINRTKPQDLNWAIKRICKILPHRIRVYFFSWVFVPDENIGWKKSTLKKAFEIIDREKIDLIYTTSSPYTNHLIGLDIKSKYTEIPWVADFRDEWSKNPFAIYPTWLHRKLNTGLEKKVLDNADKVISVTNSLTEEFSKIVRQDPDDKFETISNGFDSEDFSIKPYRINMPSKFVIVYIGSLYGGQKADNFLKGLSQLIDENESMREKIAVYFVGKINKLDLSKYNLVGVVQVIGFVTHKKAISYLLGSDVALLIISSKRGRQALTGKIFEYLGSRKPILALVPPNGEASELIRRTKSGVVVDPDNPRLIKNEILKLYKSWGEKKLKLNSNWNIISSYDRKKLTENLSGVFNRLVEKND